MRPSFGQKLKNYALSNAPSIGGFIGGLFGPNPYSAYSEGLSPIPGMVQKYLNPYMQEGQQDIRPLHEQFASLINNPSAMLAQFGKGFQSSPGYQYDVNQAIKAAQHAASAEGMLGTPQEQADIAQRVEALADKDYQNYLQNVMGLYGRGLGGLQGLEGQGYGAANTLASTMALIQELQAKAAEEAAQQKDKQDTGIGSFFGSLLGGIGSLF